MSQCEFLSTSSKPMGFFVDTSHGREDLSESQGGEFGSWLEGVSRERRAVIGLGNLKDRLSEPMIFFVDIKWTNDIFCRHITWTGRIDEWIE